MVQFMDLVANQMQNEIIEVHIDCTDYRGNLKFHVELFLFKFIPVLDLNLLVYYMQ